MSNADLSDFAPLDGPKARPGMVGLIVSALAWGGWLGLLAFVVPRFEVVFRDFGIELGGPMMLAVHASHHLFVLVPLAVGVLAADAWHRDVLWRKKGRPRPGFAWTSLVLGVPNGTHRRDDPGDQLVDNRPPDEAGLAGAGGGFPASIREDSMAGRGEDFSCEPPGDMIRVAS